MENATSGDRGGHGDLCHNVVVLENSVELRRPRAEVFDYCSDIRNEREWNPTIRSVELLTPDPCGRVGLPCPLEGRAGEHFGVRHV